MCQFRSTKEKVIEEQAFSADVGFGKMTKKRTKVFLQWWETSLTLDFPQMLNVNSNFRKPYLGRGGLCVCRVWVYVFLFIWGRRAAPFPVLSAPPFSFSSNVRSS